MAKEMATKAAMAAAENLLQGLMPQLLQRLDLLESKMDRRFSETDRHLANLTQEMQDRFEQTRDVINELGQRIARMEGKLEAYMDTMRMQTQTMEKWIERVVQVEMMQNARRKKAS